MADLRMTPARIALLRAVADPNVEVYGAIRGLRGGSWSTADVFVDEPGELSRKVTTRAGELEAAGLIKRDQGTGLYRAPRHYTLTDAGRQVLNALDATTEPEED